MLNKKVAVCTNMMNFLPAVLVSDADHRMLVKKELR